MSSQNDIEDPFNITIYYHKSKSIQNAKRFLTIDIISYTNQLLNFPEKIGANVKKISIFIQASNYLDNILNILPNAYTLLGKIYGLTTEITIFENNIYFTIKYNKIEIELVFVLIHRFKEMENILKNKPQVNKYIFAIDTKQTMNIFSELFDKVSNAKIIVKMSYNVENFCDFKCVNELYNEITLENQRNYSDFLSKLGSSISSLKIHNCHKFDNDINSLTLSNLTTLDICNKSNNKFTYFIKKHTSITNLIISSPYHRVDINNDLLEYLITNTHITSLKYDTGLGNEGMKQILENNTTLRKLYVKPSYYYGRPIDIKIIQPNFKVIKSKHEIHNCEPLIYSKCKYATFRVYKDYTNLLFENLDNIALCSLIYNLDDDTEHLEYLKRIAKRTLVKNTTLVMLLCFEAYYYE